MPERAFSTDTWGEDWFQGLSKEQRYLFIYLGTNSHVNPSGTYYITLSTMAFETKFSLEELPELLKSLSPKAEWYPEQNYVWVRSFIKQQAKSPKFLIAAAKCLKNIKNNGLVKEVINYNLKEHSILIPYEYDSDSVSVGYGYPTDTSLTPSLSNTGPETKASAEGKGELSAEETEIITHLTKLKGWQADEDDVLWLQGLRSEFPGLTLSEVKACVDYYTGRALPKHKGIWKNRFRNWMIKKREFEKESKVGQQLPTIEELVRSWKGGGDEDDPDKYIKGKYGHMVRR